MPVLTPLLPGEKLIGKTAPRVYTPPRVIGPPGPCGCGCALTPETSLGFDVVGFAQDLGFSLIPYQRWVYIHALELNPDGTFRFKYIILLVARQNGKTTLLAILILWYLFIREVELVLGTAQSLDQAEEAWNKVVEYIESDEYLSQELPPNGVVRVNGKKQIKLYNSRRYKIAAATRKGGRGASADVVIMDEGREQQNFEAWGAITKTTMAKPEAQIWMPSNAGDIKSIVLSSHRDKGRAYAANPDDADPTFGYFEYAALGPRLENLPVEDREGWAMANPALGYLITESSVNSSMMTDPPEVFRTEVLCQWVIRLEICIDPDVWLSCADADATLDQYRRTLGACVDVSPDQKHVAFYVASKLPGGLVRVEYVWSSDERRPGTPTDQAQEVLGALLRRVQPRRLVWFPGGGTVALSSFLRSREIRNAEELSEAVALEVCAEFVQLVESRKLRHPNEPLLNAHVGSAEKFPVGDKFKFSRRGEGHVTALYAAAGAVHAARNLPPIAEPMKVILPR